MKEEDRAVVNRLARIIGHSKKVRDMVENGRDCSEVLIQLAAVKSALNGVGKEVLKEYIRESLETAVKEDNPDEIKKMNRNGQKG